MFVFQLGDLFVRHIIIVVMCAPHNLKNNIISLSYLLKRLYLQLDLLIYNNLEREIMAVVAINVLHVYSSFSEHVHSNGKYDIQSL